MEIRVQTHIVGGNTCTSRYDNDKDTLMNDN